MSRKFFFSFVALVVLLSMVLASCGMPTPDVVTEEPPVETEEPATPEPTEETTPEPTEEPLALEQGNWDPENWATMQEFITTYGPENPVAAFDWDNTCIFHDIGEATFRYTLFNLKFKMDPEMFNTVIPEAAGATLDATDVTALSEDYGGVALADLAADIESDYAYLYDTYEGLGCESDCKTLDEIKETPEYQDFIAKLPFMYDGLTETDGVGANYSYPWVTFFYAGYTLDEVKVLAREAFDEQSAVTIEKVTLASPESLPGKAGMLEYTYKAGVRATPEIANLMVTMREAGFDVWVITASFEGTVQSVSEPDAYGYDVPNDHVIGIRLKTDADGKYLPEVDDSEGYAITYRQGKADVLRNLVGKAPIFAAGDSDTDFEMMTSFAETKMGLVVNRLKGGDIGSLYGMAVSDTPYAGRYLLQGRDENEGLWRPAPETIKLGETDPRPVEPDAAMGNWDPYNWSQIQSFVETYGPENPVAAFDWDNTCIFHDIGEATFRYTLFNLKFKMDPETFAAVIPEAAGATLDGTDVTVLSEDYGGVALADLAADIESDYAYLYDTYEGLGCESDCKTLDEIKETPEYQDFIAKLPFMYDGLTETDGVGANYSYPWVTFFYAGYTLDEVKVLAREAFDEQSAVAIEKVTLASPESLPGKAGMLEYTYKAGVRATPEIANLMGMMREAGFDVWVITASFEGTVQSVSEPDAYGYDVPNDHVIGIRLKTDADGKYLPEVDDSEGYAITYRQGKADVLMNLVGKAPIFAAGDSDTDFEMMTSFAETKMGLVVNRLKGGDIGSLYGLSLPWAEMPGRYLLQGRNENEGLWRQGRETIKLGEEEPRTVEADAAMGNWDPYNWSQIQSFVETYGPENPVAAFDWDNTCIFHDIGEATFRYTLFNLKFKMDPETFAAVIPEAAGATLDGTDVTVLSEDYGSVVIADLAADIESDYAYLYETYEGLGCESDCKTLDEIKETPEYQDFIAKLPFMYDGLTETDGVGANYSYPWVTFFYAGYTLDEVKVLAREAFDEQSAVAIEKVKLTSPESLPGEAGVLSYSYKAGVRATPEISGLMAMMREAGFDVWVITASFEGTVQSVSEPDAYGYDVPNDHVIGIRLKTDADGKYLPEVDDSEGYAITYRQGKADVLNNLVGKAPIFAAGDSDTDFEMMTLFPETKMSLVVNRLKGGDIGSLYTLSLPWAEMPGRYLLQGRDENEGLWRPSRETVKLGESAPRPVE